MIININTDKECIQKLYCQFKGVKKNVVNNWIARDKLKTRRIEELNLILIQIPNDEKEDWKKWKKTNNIK